MPGMAMAWYSPEAWLELAAIPEAKIDMTYDEYLRNCHSYIERFKKHNISVDLIPVNVGQMVEWCRKHGCEIDCKGRATFGAVLAACCANGADVMSTGFKDGTKCP